MEYSTRTGALREPQRMGARSSWGETRGDNSHLWGSAWCKLRLPASGMRRQIAKIILILAAGSFLLGLRAALVPGQGHGDQKDMVHKDLIWAPPNVNATLPSLATTPPCDVSKVLQAVGAHAAELTTNLENFSAEERIQYEMLDRSGFAEHSDESVFDYVFAFEQQGGARSSREYRTPAKGNHNFDASRQDTGQVALALIFLPHMQSDYEMSCEGLDRRNGQGAWVIRFQQRKDKPRRTLLFRSADGVYPAMLKGRAWIGEENSQVLRLETSLMQDIPAMNIESGTISVEYAPVEVQSRKLELWLPERIEAYWKVPSHRIILYHSFSDFRIFAVDTEQNIQKPKEH
jgi:hypothetical protein